MKDICYLSDRNQELQNVHMTFVSHNVHNVFEFHKGRPHEMFLFTTKGDVIYEALDGSYRLEASKGALVYLPAGERTRTIYSDGESEVLSVSFDTEGGRLYDEKKIIPPGSSEGVLRVALRLELELKNNRDQDQAFFYALVYKLVHHFNNHMNTVTPKKYLKLFPIMLDLRTNPQSDKRIEEYAAMCGMSEVGFRRLFTEYTGVTPVEYRTKLRLNLANTMLRGGEYSIGDVALKCGFNSASFFCREYKKVFGVSAGQAMRKKY